MMTFPETKYAKSGDCHIAYQAIGTGPLDLVFMYGWISHIEHMWEEPRVARFLDRLASFSRLILLDKRGTGLSDQVPLDRLPTLEERMDDARAVLGGHVFTGRLCDRCDRQAVARENSVRAITKGQCDATI
jgi:pimeloyl-ACP methyl ester carboxylesterase